MSCPFVIFQLLFPLLLKTIGTNIIERTQGSGGDHSPVFSRARGSHELTPACNIDSQALNMNGQDIFMISGF